jgi:hypoxanthine phosphoribosyltransferase
MDKPPKFKYITQDQIDEIIQKLIIKIKKSSIPYTKIVGIAKGGLNISKPLSKALKLPHQDIYISFYNKEFKILDHYKPRFKKLSFKLLKSDNILIVDDLIDSGRTIDYFMKKYNLKQSQNCSICCLFYNKDNICKLIPDYYHSFKAKNWLVFPWE